MKMLPLALIRFLFRCHKAIKNRILRTWNKNRIGSERRFEGNFHQPSRRPRHIAQAVIVDLQHAVAAVDGGTNLVGIIHLVFDHAFHPTRIADDATAAVLDPVAKNIVVGFAFHRTHDPFNRRIAQGEKLEINQQFPVEIWVVDLQRVMRFSEIGFRRLFSGLFLFLSFS